MFTLPPRPPKDYTLKEVSLNQTSAPEFTPAALPRATQTTLAQYCYPVPANDNEPADKTQIETINDQVLDRKTKYAKAYWVDKPGANAFMINDIFRKYSVVVDPNYDVRFKHKPRVLQRSYKYEFDCMEDARLQKLASKIKKEEEDDEEMLVKFALQERKNENKPLIMDVCKKYPPFWWKEPEEVREFSTAKEIQIKPEKSIYQSSYVRWVPIPKLFEEGESDPCKRREIFAQFRQPFKNEAANWYFKNYPPPTIKFRPEKFSQ